MNKRLLSMFLALCMIVTMLPVSAMAEEIHTTIGGSGEIISFAPLTETEKTVSPGKSGEDLELPETLTATVRTAVPAAENPTQDSGSPETATPTTATEPEWKETTVDIPVTWESTPEYDMETEGEYVFMPVIEGYTVSAKLPEFTVMVGTAMARVMSRTAGIQAQWGLAGEDGSQPGTWAEGTLAAAMEYANELSTGTAYIQLGANIDKDNHTAWPLTFSSGKTTILDLNGNSINRGLTETTDNGNVIKVGGTLTIKDSSTFDVAKQGEITGGYNKTGNYTNGFGGGGVLVAKNATFTFQGGKITGNKTTSNDIGGGGVYVSTEGTFNMQGGSIEDNQAKKWGGGVYSNGPVNMTGGTITGNSSEEGGVYFSGTFSVGGTAVIENNSTTETPSVERNVVVFNNNPIGVTTPFTAGAKIGVTADNPPTTGSQKNITGSNSHDYSSYFFSDSNTYAIQNSGSGSTQVVQLIVNFPKAITAFNFNGLTPTVTGTVNEANKTVALTVPSGTTVTALVPTITHTGASISPNTGVSGDFTSPVTYTVTAANSTTQAYTVTVTVAAKDDTVSEQFNLTPGDTYYFDLSGEKNNVGTINTALPDATLHYVPFTYTGTVNAYSLTSAMAITQEQASESKSDRSLFVGDYVIGTSVTWDSLDTANLIFGKAFDTNYNLRSLSAGSSQPSSIAIPDTNEWDQILAKSGSIDNTTGWIKNWNSMLSWGQDTSAAVELSRAYRGGLVQQWDHSSSLSVYPNLGFRPALEVLNPGTLGSDGLKAVTLNLNGGKLKGSTADIQVICAGDEFTAPSGEGLTAPSGKTFDGWKDSGGTAYAAGAHVPNTVTGLRAQWAAPATAYDIWVGGVRVTSTNKGGITGTGITGTITYDPDSSTLTLNGAEIGAESQYQWSSTTVVDAKAHAAVYAKESLNVVLTGNNSLTGGSQDGDRDESYGLYCGGALNITGGGTLEALGATMDKFSCVSFGLYVNGALSVGDGTTVTARGGDVTGGNGVSFGVFGMGTGGLTVEDATLTVASGIGYNGYGVRIMQGDINITNSNVTVTSGATYMYSRALEANNGDILISGGTVSASAEEGNSPAYCIAISIPNGKNIAISSSAVVTARAGSAGYGGCAMSQAPNLDSYGSEYYITASRAYNGGSPETYNASSITNYRYLDIRQRTATPTTGTTSASKSSASQNSISFTLTNMISSPFGV